MESGPMEAGQGSDAATDQVSAALEANVPPRHWVYRVLADLAGHGLVERYPAFAFSGGRVFSRGDLARITGRLLDLARRRGNLPAADLQQIGRLAREFAAELDALGLDSSLPAAPEATKPADTTSAPAVPTPPRFGVTGSNTFRVSSEEGDGNDKWSNRIDLEIRMDRVQVRLQGQAENRPIEDQAVREAGDASFALGGQDASFDLTDRYVKVDLDPAPGVDTVLQVGTVDNVSMAHGLVLGATDVHTGARMESKLWDRAEFVVLYGETPPDREDLTASRLVVRPAPALEIGASFLRVEDDRKTGPSGARQGRIAAGGDLSLAAGPVELSAEAARTESHTGAPGGEGYYGELTFNWFRGFDLEGAYRNYRQFGFDFNNAPIYAGVSGGDDTDEHGWALTGVLSPASMVEGLGTRLPGFLTFLGGMELRGGLDTSEKHLAPAGTDPVTGLPFKPGDTGVTDYIGELSYRLGRSTSLGATYEVESPENKNAGRVSTSTHVVSGRVSHTVGDGAGLLSGWNVTLDYNRDWDNQNTISTWRSQVKVPLAKDKLTLSASDTFRTTSPEDPTVTGRYENDLQVRLNWKISKESVFTLRGTFPHSSSNDRVRNSMDMTLIVRF